jgi:hypothetical protein
MRIIIFAKVWGYEVQGIKYMVQGYKVMKTSKSLIKDEGDLNQNDEGWTKLLFFGGVLQEHLYLNTMQN